MNPTEEQALQFAIICQAGVPPSQAITYFSDLADPAELAELTRKWQRSRSVAAAHKRLLGKSWQEMTLQEKMENGLNQHYSALAYLLFSTNYNEVGPGDKAKLDSARTALEAKLAGQAGKGNALEQFFADLQSGRVKLNAPLPLGLQGKLQ